MQPDIEFAWLKAEDLLPALKRLATETYGDGPWRLGVQSGHIKRSAAV